MDYSSGYDGYGTPYMSSSLSRRHSMNYPPTPYPQSHQGYADDMIESEYQPPYQMYGTPRSSMFPASQRLPNPAYDLADPYHDNRLGRSMSMGHTGSMYTPRHFGRSTVSLSAPTAFDAYRVPSAIHIKFKRKGSFSSGIGLAEAQSKIWLSRNDAYSFHDLHAERRGRINLCVQWTGYLSLTYEIPLDGYDGRVDLKTLARRVARSCVHYFQANAIPIAWDRVVLHHLEEVSYGVWRPMLSTR